MNLKRFFAVLLAAVVIAGSLAVSRYDQRLAPAGIAPAAAAAAVATPGAAQVGPALPDFRSIVARYGAAVVNISTEGLSKAAAGDLPSQLFGGAQAPQIVHGLGSGFIVSPDGVVLTNAHVVADASEVTVKLTDRREFRAKVLGSDAMTDIAVLKIEAKDLPTVPLGDSAGVSPGDWVLAIGSPFGFDNSVTAGIVSAKRRMLPGDGYVPFIQTDVAVNPGNSGGPLFNVAGEVIGINSQIFSQTGGYQGLAFAIPIDLALRIQKQIVAHGHATHARLGVAIQGLNPALADSFGLKSPAGALVSSVVPDSPAASAGLQPGDVVLAANGQAIAEAGDLPALVDKASPGEKIALSVWRKGEARALVATLGEVKPSTVDAAQSAHAKPGRLGLALRPLTSEERSAAGVSGGLIVEEAGGPSARAGIQPGDIVLAVNGIPVKSAEALSLALGKAKGVVALLVQRGDAAVYVPIQIG